MKNKLPTCKQLEIELSRSIKKFYANQIDFSPAKISCKLFSRYLIVIIEEGLSLVEQSLWQAGEKKLIRELTGELNNILKLELAQTIPKILEVDTIEILSSVTYQTNKLGILVVLSQPPLVRDLKTAIKARDK